MHIGWKFGLFSLVAIVCAVLGYNHQELGPTQSEKKLDQEINKATSELNSMVQAISKVEPGVVQQINYAKEILKVLGDKAPKLSDAEKAADFHWNIARTLHDNNEESLRYAKEVVKARELWRKQNRERACFLAGLDPAKTKLRGLAIFVPYILYHPAASSFKKLWGASWLHELCLQIEAMGQKRDREAINKMFKIFAIDFYVSDFMVFGDADGNIDWTIDLHSVELQKKEQRREIQSEKQSEVFWGLINNFSKKYRDAKKKELVQQRLNYHSQLRMMGMLEKQIVAFLDTHHPLPEPDTKEEENKKEKEKK